MTLLLAALLFLLALSIFLIIVEIFFIPGTTLFGIAGGIGAIISIYYAFQESTNVGYIAIAAAVVFFIIFFILGKNMMDKSKFNLKSELTEKVNTYNDGLVNIGDKGITLSVLKPQGKAKVDNKKIEVYSFGSYIEKGVEIEIIKIEENKIFVNPLI